MYLSQLFMLFLGCVRTLGESPGAASIHPAKRTGDSKPNNGTTNDDDPYPGPDWMNYRMSDFSGTGCPNGSVGAWYGWRAIHKGSGVWIGGQPLQATIGPNISTAEHFKTCRFDFELGADGWQFRMRPSPKWILRKVTGHLALDKGVIAEYAERVYNNGAEDEVSIKTHAANKQALYLWIAILTSFALGFIEDIIYWTD